MGDPLPLSFVQSTPDADRLVDRQGIVEAGSPNDAGGADRFRLELALEALMPMLGPLGWEEDLRMGAATGGTKLPRRTGNGAG